MPNLIELGRVIGVFGVKGEVRVHLHHRASPLWRKPLTVQLFRDGALYKESQIKVRSGAGKRMLARLDCITSRDEAFEAIGLVFFVPREALPEPEVDEFYFEDLKGLPVFIEGKEAGVIRDVIAMAEMEVLEVETPEGEVFVPCISDFILSVDVPAGRVDLVVGALDEQ